MTHARVIYLVHITQALAVSASRLKCETRRFDLQLLVGNFKTILDRDFCNLRAVRELEFSKHERNPTLHATQKIQLTAKNTVTAPTRGGRNIC